MYNGKGCKSLVNVNATISQRVLGSCTMTAPASQCATEMQNTTRINISGSAIFTRPEMFISSRNEMFFTIINLFFTSHLSQALSCHFNHLN